MAIENLSPRTIVTAPETQTATATVSTASKNVDTSNYEWVDVPVEDLFGKPFGFVSINFEEFHTGRHFVNPEKATEIRRLVTNRQRSDMRVLQPNRDKEYEATMARHGKPAANMAERF